MTRKMEMIATVAVFELKIMTTGSTDNNSSIGSIGSTDKRIRA